MTTFKAKIAKLKNYQIFYLLTVEDIIWRNLIKLKLKFETSLTKINSFPKSVLAK